MSSMAVENIKTLEPSDKFMTPRPPPALPALKRLKTSPSPAPVSRKRSARSVSPKPPRSPWSPRSFFGSLRSSSPYAQEGDRRGRSSASLTKPIESESNSTRPIAQSQSRSDDTIRMRSVPRTRDASPQSFMRTRSREPSPLRHFVAKETSSYNSHSLTLVIPDEIEEEDAEDDDNFASQLDQISLHERGILTPLAPPPAGVRFPMSLNSGTNTPRDTSKPLPMLPEQLSLALAPPPLRIRDPVPAAEMPRSHFSTSTISTTLTSPTDSHFGFSETPSIADSNEDEDLAADTGSGDESTYSPVKEAENRFNGYSLPDTDFTSELSLGKSHPISPLTQAASRTTFGGAVPFVPSAESDAQNMSALEQLLSEMGYLGDAITGK
jgi:hypothetical protein